jgi:hypothetical protein
MSWHIDKYTIHGLLHAWYQRHINAKEEAGCWLTWVQGQESVMRTITSLFSSQQVV